ncbi:hypothetical protein [Sphingomonas oryzagri]
MSSASRSAAILLTMLIAGVGAAQTVPAPEPASDSTTLRLSDEERARLLAGNTEEKVDAARAGLGGGAPSRQIHGEIGAMIGTHGTRGIYGTAAVPLGDNAGATVSFKDSRYGYGRRR